MKTFSRRGFLRTTTAAAALLPFASACAPMQVAAGTSIPSGDMDGVRMAQLVANGEVTALELTEAAIARAKAVNPSINAIASPLYDEALEQAASAPEGAFGGVPTFIKDLMNWKGAPTLYGSRAFTDYVADKDDTFAARWRELGVVVLGKSTSPEMGLISSTEPLVTGPTRNPWDLSRIPGGSSGGAAALTAARVVPFAHASDGGGSIRIPAACCGLFGLKPSRGALIQHHMAEGMVELSVNHAVTLTVRDSAALFAATEDPNSGLPAVGRVMGPGSKRLRIAFAPEPINGAKLDAETRSGIERMAELCRALGHEVIDWTMPVDGKEFTEQFFLLWAAGAAEFAQQARSMKPDADPQTILEPWTLGLAQEFAERRDGFKAAIAYLKAFEPRYDAFFEDFDVILTPTLSKLPPEIGVQAPTREYGALREEIINFAAFTAPMNVAGAASMNVPIQWTRNGIPVGSLFSGRRGDDGKLLALAYELEEAQPWISRIPPVLST